MPFTFYCIKWICIHIIFYIKTSGWEINSTVNEETMEADGKQSVGISKHERSQGYPNKREVRDIQTKEKSEWSERSKGNLTQTSVCSLGNMQKELELLRRSQNCEIAGGTAHKTGVQWGTRTKNDEQGKWGMSVPFMWRSSLDVWRLLAGWTTNWLRARESGSEEKLIKAGMVVKSWFWWGVPSRRKTLLSPRGMSIDSQELEHLPCKERVRELVKFSLEMALREPKDPTVPAGSLPRRLKKVLQWHIDLMERETTDIN